VPVDRLASYAEARFEESRNVSSAKASWCSPESNVGTWTREGRMTPSEWITCYEDRALRAVALASANMGAAAPSCPGWTGRDVQPNAR
jgi:hypothetical protein